MRLVFDPDFGHGCWPGPLGDREAVAGEDWVGPWRLVQVLETALGLGGPRLTPYERAARLVRTIRRTDGFWSASATVDPFATARRLLQWRDTLAMGGWRGDGSQPRIAALATLMADCDPGLPDRLEAIHAALATRSGNIERVDLLTPRTDVEPLWRRTFSLLELRGTRVLETPLAPAPATPGTDLAGARSGRFVPTGDGSLCLLRPAGSLAAAEDVAAWLASAGTLRDAVVIGSDPALDFALHRHGLPTTSAAYELRDATLLQILPLVLDLGWKPQDAQRAYELLSLDPGPVPGDVARRLRGALGQWPAVGSDAWHAALTEGLEAIEDPDRRERVKARLGMLWDAGIQRGGGYPAVEVARRGGMLRDWLIARAAVADDAHVSAWQAAVRQCTSLLGLVHDSGVSELSAAQLRHLVIEATDSAAGDSPFPAQAGLRHVGSPGSVAGPARLVVWWRFDDSAPAISRLPLTRAEREELQSLGVELTPPAQVAAAQARRWRRPLDQARERLLLVCSETDAAGEEAHPHPLWDDLISRVATSTTRRAAEQRLLVSSLSHAVPQRRREWLPLPAPRREWTLPKGRVARRERESPSSVETLFGCPLQWVLRYAGRLYPPDSAQVEEGTSPRVLGELLHAIMNRLFAGPHRNAEQAAAEAGALFDLEGPRLVAALFLPGADAQRERVRRVATQTAKTLYRLMADGKLTVMATEAERVAGAFGTTIAGRVDLVLGSPSRILDLKWSGAPRKRNALKAGTALQLAAYSFLEGGKDGVFPPVGYFVMDAQRLLTTEPGAFPGAEGVDGPSPGETWRVVEHTHATAWEAVAEGRIDAPPAETREGEKPLTEARVVDGRLLMPAACRWCDYAVLCGVAFEEDA